MPDRYAPLQQRLLQPDREFTIEEARKIVDDIYEHCRIDTQDRFHNPFFHEICPLLLIAEHVEDKLTRIVFKGGNARFDGGIIRGVDRRFQKVELTAAIDGHQEALRMELLAARGHAPAFQTIRAGGTKRHRTFSVDDDAYDAFDSAKYDQDTLRPLLERALKLKVEKARMNPDYDGAWLGIVFDDWVMPIDGRKSRRFDPLCRQVLADETRRYHPFSRVFFIGISRKYIFDSCADRRAHETSP